MLKQSFAEFEFLSQGHDLVPVYAEFLADLDTPVSVLSRFIGDENVLLLESIEGGERFGRYSFIGLNPYALFRISAGKAYYEENGVCRELPHEGNPFEALRRLVGQQRIAATPGLPPLFGGAMGMIGYEAVQYFVNLPAAKIAPETSDASFMLTDELVAVDNRSHTIKTIISVRLKEYAGLQEAYQDAELRARLIMQKIQLPMRLRPEARLPESLPELQSNMSKEEFCRMAEEGKEQTVKGEVLQIVLSQRFGSAAVSSPLQIYRALRLQNPAPYTFFLKLGELALLGSSPETMVKLENRCSSLRPIAGTRRRGRSESEDRALADELLKDEKERAEHIMLVDLGHHDLVRNALPNSVQVKSFMRVERYSQVMHLVSDLEAILAPEYDAFDLLQAALPAGTLSGSPKTRAMQLINELEPEARGVYGGAVGYFSYNGNMDLCITIRTIEIRNGKLHIQVGAGIVNDSQPEIEYAETINKASALFKAINLAAHNFKLAEM